MNLLKLPELQHFEGWEINLGHPKVKSAFSKDVHIF